MKKIIAIILSAMMVVSAFSATIIVNAAQTTESAQGISFDTKQALYVHAVLNSEDTEAWQEWQCEHDEDFVEVNPDVKYFFLPTSADDENVDVYNGFAQTVNVNGVAIAPQEAKTVSYNVNDVYSVDADGKTYTLKFMKSNAEAGIYINNSDADGNGTDLMDYLNVDKSNEAKATGAIVTADGAVDNSTVKKIKGRGNTTWDKPKKAYNITYDDSVSIDGMPKGKKYSILANYQDDSLSRNRFLYDLSDAVGMPYASDSRFVDFYVNGYYWGSYMMTQKVDVGKNSVVNDISDSAYLNDDGTINTDFPFVCEVDASAVDGEDYYVETSSGNKVSIKSPELEVGDVGYEEVQNYVETKFDAFFNAVKSKTADLTQYADVDSLAKIYLINELGKNWDAGVSSLFFTYKQDADGNYKFYGSPVWDYDNSLGNATGVEYELGSIGVDDYEEYSGWWCQYKGKRSSSKSSSNIMNNMSKNATVLETATNVWFEKFVPAIDAFSSNTSESSFYSKATYYNFIKGSAEMNYQSGWLLNTGDWISDHSTLNTATFNMTTGTYKVSSKTTNYSQNFEGMFNYCADWLTSRAAWMSSEMYADYTPPAIVPELGDANCDGRVTIMDATKIQKYAGGLEDLTDAGKTVSDVNGDGKINVVDATDIQKFLAGIESPLS